MGRQTPPSSLLSPQKHFSSAHETFAHKNLRCMNNWQSIISWNRRGGG